MGLKNNQKYSMTVHAVQRYRERFVPSDSEETIKRKVCGWLGQSDYLSKEPNNCQSWIYRDLGIIIIVNPKTLQVITLYKTLSEYTKELELEQEVQAEYEEVLIHPKAEEIVSELVRAKYRSVKTDYYEQLGSLYKEYGDRIDKLSRTTKPLMFKEKEDEAKEIMKQIRSIETESKEVMKSLKAYILEGEYTHE